MSLRYLDRKLVLKRPVRVADLQGGHKETWEPVGAEGVLCRVTDANSAEREIGGRQEGAFTHYVYVHRRQDVKRGDRFEFTDGTFLEVTTVWRDDRPGGYAKCRAWQRQEGQ